MYNTPAEVSNKTVGVNSVSFIEASMNSKTPLPMMLFMTSVSSWMRPKEGLLLSCRCPSWGSGDMHGVMSAQNRWQRQELYLSLVYSYPQQSYTCHFNLSFSILLLKQPPITGNHSNSSYQQGCCLAHSPTLGRCWCPTAQRTEDPDKSHTKYC